MGKAYNKAIKNRPQKAWAGLANARLLLRRYAMWLYKMFPRSCF
ncbi:hypothetical protein SOHN41_00963 [Shewanella sp. HN-41]|nr:hypothetical protein SOHN41_00963 [Shewanella sp. HN-41]